MAYHYFLVVLSKVTKFIKNFLYVHIELDLNTLEALI